MATRYLENRSEVDNRYALTAVHIDDSVAPGRRRYGLWQVPAIVSRPEISLPEGSYTRYTVSESDIGRIDIIAWRHYNDVSMWWVIAYYNGIANPLTQLVPGAVLLVPKKEFVVKAMEQQNTFV